jgi:hypothetical protein
VATSEDDDVDWTQLMSSDSTDGSD